MVPAIPLSKIEAGLTIELTYWRRHTANWKVLPTENH